MILPDLDPTGGNLSISSVLLDYDGPQIFVARNKGRSAFIAMHAIPDRTLDRWIYCRISNSRLTRYRNGQESLRKIFENPEFSSPIIVSYADDGASYINWLPADYVLRPLLPDRDSFLHGGDSIGDEKHSMNALVPVGATEDAIVVDRAKSPLWEMDPMVVDFLASRRTPAHVVADATKRAVIDFAFSVGKGRTDYPIRDLGSVLNSTQGLFDSLTLTDSESKERGPVPKGIRSDTQLLAVASFPSSFGLRLESASGDLLGDGRVIDALRIFIDLILSVGISDQFESVLRSMPKRSQRHFKAFARAMRNGKSDLSLKSAIPGQYSDTEAYLSKSDIVWMEKKLSNIVDDTEREFEFKGRLTGFSLKRRFFVLSNDESEYSGRIAKDIVHKINDKRVNHEHVSKIREIISVNEATGEEVPSYELIDIEEID